MQEPDYGHIERALRRLGAPLDASECHGLLCGMLCAGRPVEADAWLAEFVESQGETGDVLWAEAEAALRELFAFTARQMGVPGFALQPCLPDDDVSLRLRAAAIGAWCQGFIYGLGVSGAVDEGALPSDTRELLADFNEIARAELAADEDRETAEGALAELIEYVRVGVLLIREELQPSRPTRH